MSENDDRPQDGSRPQHDDGSSSEPDQGGSALGGYPWDDPGATSAPDPSGPTPAAYPPAAPYPPAYSSQVSGPDPTPVPLTKPMPGEPAPVPAGSPYEQQEPYGQQQPYGQGYGPSASYTTTPQPYAYGPAPLSPEAEKVRSSAVLWTILNGVAIFLCGNLLAIGGVILAALAIGKAREDAQGARTLVKWSWILFAIGFAFALILLIGYVVFVVFLGMASMGSGF